MTAIAGSIIGIAASLLDRIRRSTRVERRSGRADDVDKGGFGQVNDGLDFVDGACFGKQAAGKLQTSER